ncbi:isopeptide-forming domain-containing fimbrial protein [Propionicicella superfundia]|uniref:isopeptide-forming domain-containing fimbrial protein n=1 Tax=Propionicicella superfundia TaxID=348582 RepID=UPI0012EB0605|nr:isopeptide-forming domain-containing fimbrial protein [Propionicicella superfundia]
MTVVLALVAAQFISVVPSATAALGDPAALSLQKTVEGADEVEVGPTDSFQYQLRVGCDDNPCIGAAVTDQLPAELAGFTIDSLSVVLPSGETSPVGTATLAGCSVGGQVTTDCVLTADFTKGLGSLDGVPQVGIPAGQTYRIDLRLVVPSDLPATWAYNGDPIENTAQATADNAEPAEDTAAVTVSVPIEVDVEATKSWSPTSQQFAPGTESSFTIGAQNASNVPAADLVLEDAPGAADGATALDAGNPFTYVDFVGLCSSSGLPDGADQVQVDLYARTSGAWAWVTGSPAGVRQLPELAAGAEVGGIRFTYTSSTGTTVEADATAEECVTVEQRTTNRTSGASLVSGATVDNTVSATVTVPGQDPAVDTASADLVIGPITVQVTPGKTIEPATVPAGGTFNMSLGAKNDSNGPLSELTIAEPAAGTDPFLSADLTLTGFTSWTWPAGADEATFTWHFADGDEQEVTLHESDGAPSVPDGEITGFAVTYTGSIAAGVAAGFAVDVETAADMVPADTEYLTFNNTMEASGTNPAGTDTVRASDDVRVFYPTLEVTLDKSVSPSVVAIGDTVVAELPTETAMDTARANPSVIEITDGWNADDQSAFWDAFRVRRLSFVQIPAGATLAIYYTTDPLGSASWQPLETGLTIADSPYSRNLVADPVAGVDADDIVGLRFVYTDADGFAQGTIVKPNIVFEAAATLRDGTPIPEPAEGEDSRTTTYTNTAHADSSGFSGGVLVEGDEVAADDQTGIVVYAGDSPGLGRPIAEKRWVDGSNGDLADLAAQSSASAWTNLGWGVTRPGYTQVTVSDAEPGAETTPADTVYQAFNLTAVNAVTFTQDPLLRWDTVSEIWLYNSDVAAWQQVAVPGGSWMSTTGFKGYNLSAAEQARTTGVRIVVRPNDTARNTNWASSSPDLTAPQAGSGVASAATARLFKLTWQLRNTLRVPSGSALDQRFATGTTAFNTPDAGVVENTVRVTASTGSGDVSWEDDDTIKLNNGVPNTGASKSASPTSVVVPYPDDVPAANYPTIRYTLRAWNASDSRASYLRVTDPVPCTTPTDCVTQADEYTDPGAVFDGATYDPAENPFERLTVTDVTFQNPQGLPVDLDVTRVAVWHYNAGTTTVTEQSLRQFLDASATDLADVIGFSVVYSSSDPASTGGLFPAGNANDNSLILLLDTRLRPTLRSTGATTAGDLTLDNDLLAQSHDPVLAPAARPNASATTPVQLRAADLDVTASKSLSPDTILETNPSVPVTVTLGATDGSSTVAAETATISDTDTGFWDAFEFSALGSVTRPAGADRVRVDVQVGDDPAWIEGTAATSAALPSQVSDPSTITGIRFVFLRSDGLPFSATAPSADWSAQAVFTVRLRDGASFPGEVANTVTSAASHRGYTEVSQSADDGVTLSTGTPRLDVRKDPGVNPKVVEPGVSVPWTFTFTNVGTSYLGVNEVVDSLGPWLRYDGSEPVYSSTGALPETGVTISQSGAENITFTFPDDAPRMAPGDSFTITVGIILVPGLTADQRATNSFYVDTDETLAAGDCVNRSGNGQGILSGLAANQCGSSNFVNPQAGALLFGEKEVRGEVDGTLVDGASNVVNPDLPCEADTGAFFRTVCVPYTTIGATDEWRIGAANTGTVPYSTLTLVDVLPTPGDRLLATGAARGSDWRSVLDLDFGVQETITETFPADGVPAGTEVVVEVTTAAGACVGTDSGSAWTSDPTCSSHPVAAQWQTLASYSGDAAAITALRITLDFRGTATGSLPPGGSVHFLYRTSNVPWQEGDLPTAEAVRADLLSTDSTISWNQTGVSATLSTNGQRISRAPERSGVQLTPSALAVAKTVSGPNAAAAPSSFTFDLSCTVPDGAGGSVPVVLGESATVSVPADGTARVDGVPLGATCTLDEAGDVGEFGESVRTPAGGRQTRVLQRARARDAVPTAQTLSFDNRYDDADLAIEKQVDSVAPNAGGPISWTLTVSNAGPGPSFSTAAEPITVTDTVPDWVDDVGVSGSLPDGWSLATPGPFGAGDTITLVLADGRSLPATGEGSSVSFTLEGTLDAALPPDTEIVNTATVTPGPTPDPDPDNNTDGATTTPGTDTTLAIAKTRVVRDGDDWVPAASLDPVPSVVPGRTVTYVLTVANTGSADARNVTVTDEVPDELSYASFEAITGGWTRVSSDSGEGADQRFSLDGVLMPGATASLLVTFDIDPGLDSDIDNWAQAEADNSPTKPRDDDSTGSTRVANLSIAKTHTGSAVAGTGVPYTITVTNEGPSDSSGPIVVTDTLPGGFGYTAGSATVSIAGASPIPVEPTVAGRTLTWSVGADDPSFTLPADTTIAIRFTAAVDATLTDQSGVLNHATVDGPDDPDPSDDGTDDPTDIVTLAGVTIAKQAVTQGPFTPGGAVRYELTVTNSGPSVARDLTVSDVAPAGLTIESMSGDGWQCALRTATCTRPDQAVATSTITVVARVAADAAAGAELDNQATVAWTNSSTRHAHSDNASITVTRVSGGLATTGAATLPALVGAALLLLAGIVLRASRRPREE